MKLHELVSQHIHLKLYVYLTILPYYKSSHDKP